MIFTPIHTYRVYKYVLNRIIDNQIRIQYYPTNMHHTQESPRVNKEDLELLHNDFTSIGEFISISWRVIRTNFKPVLAKAVIYKSMILLFLIACSIVFATTSFNNVSPSVDVTLGEEEYTLEEYQDIAVYLSELNDDELTNLDVGFNTDRFEEFVAENRVGVLSIVSAFVIVFLFTSIAVQLIDVRTYEMLHDTSDKVFLRLSDGIVYKVIQLILMGFIFNAARQIITGIITVGNDPSQVTAGGMLLEFTSNSLITFLTLSLFGLTSFVIIFEKVNVIEAIGRSFTLIQPYYWLNVLRWLVLQIILVVLRIVSYAFLIAGAAFIPSFFSSFDPGQIFSLTGIVVVISSIVGFIIVDTTQYVLSFLSYYNIQSIHQSDHHSAKSFFG